MKPKIKFYESLYYKNYFWYLIRSINFALPETHWKVLDGHSPIDDRHIGLLYIDDMPIIIDARDSIHLPPNKYLAYDDFLIYKANYSSEIWNKIPDNFEYRLDDWELRLKNKIRPYMLGRRFPMLTLNRNEFSYRLKDSKPNVKIFSYSGAGIFEQQTKSRIKVYELFSKVFDSQAKLMLRSRLHFREKAMFPNWEQLTQKFKDTIPRKGENPDYQTYIQYLSMGEFSINFPGLALSTPSRFVDAVIADRCVISTKIWTDCYKDFPCVQLPICGYLGTGDWKKAGDILRTINEVNQKELKLKMRKWYNKYFSAEGMWKNQILKGLEK